MSATENHWRIINQLSPWPVANPNRKAHLYVMMFLGLEPQTNLGRLGDSIINEVREDDGMKIDRVLDLVEAAYIEGWGEGARTGDSDSPDWNVGEDWANSSCRQRMIAIENITHNHKHHLLNILAILHRDGGHYTNEHGIERSVEDAMKIASNLVVTG